MKITKEHIGKTVYLKPTGNNVSRFAPDKIFTAKVVKMARTRGELLFEGYVKYTTKFTISDHNDNHIRNGLNSGYIVYESMEELQQDLRVTRILQFLMNNCRFGASANSSIPKEKWLSVGDILEIE